MSGTGMAIGETTISPLPRKSRISTILPHVFLLKRPVFGEQLGMSCTFVIRHRCRITRQRPQPVAVAVGQVECDLDPLPALNRNRLSLGLGLEFVRHQPIEQGRVFESTAVIALEQVMQHRAARRFVGLNTHKDCTPVGRPDRGLGQHAPDLEWLLVPG